MMYLDNNTICAIATPPGNGAIALLRVSGDKAFDICDDIVLFKRKGKKIANQKTQTIHYCNVMENDIIIDDVLVGIYKKPHSYTGEDLIEISCHGSRYIQQKILEILINKGARLAQPGEFTLRAFLNGKMDLTQAEAVADLIQSNNKVFHDTAINQMRGGITHELTNLRQELLHFASLIELELDFSEEDVEFANRTDLKLYIDKVQKVLSNLIQSFSYGNAIKNGIPVAIIGSPNVGKSTLLNALLKEEKAIVSEIPGTTRDTIEDTIHIEGIEFRFIDTAGIRNTRNKIESLGIKKTFEKINRASIILYLFDISEPFENIKSKIKDLKLKNEQKLIILLNKIDKIGSDKFIRLYDKKRIDKKVPVILISAKQNIQIDMVIQFLIKSVQKSNFRNNDLIITNIRHYDALKNAFDAGIRVTKGLKLKLTNDLLAQDIREMLYYIGTITGEITNNEILNSIFKNFCIGK